MSAARRQSRSSGRDAQAPSDATRMAVMAFFKLYLLGRDSAPVGAWVRIACGIEARGRARRRLERSLRASPALRLRFSRAASSQTAWHAAKAIASASRYLRVLAGQLERRDLVRRTKGDATLLEPVCWPTEMVDFGHLWGGSVFMLLTGGK